MVGNLDTTTMQLDPARLYIKIPKDRRTLVSKSIHSVTLAELIFITNSVIFKCLEDRQNLRKYFSVIIGGEYDLQI